MSTAPSRTRSLRKPAEITNRLSRSYATDSNEPNTTSRLERGAQSPSRLPKAPAPSKPLTRSSIARPPSATGSTISSASTRQPPSRANISRPASTGLSRSTSKGQSNAPPRPDIDPVKKDRSRPPIVTSRHLRNASISSPSTISTSNPRPSSHTRTKSSSTLNTSTASAILRPPTSNRNSVILDEPKSQAGHAESQLRRPAFSTLQQHFSPTRNLAPKPHPAAFLAPPSPSKLPSNIAISAEISKLQNELLQLHLLHKDAGRVGKEWRASTKRKLGERFQSVVNTNDALVQSEVEETGKINALALKKWHDQGAPGWGLDEKIQVLDEVVSGVWNLGGSGGKYSRIVKKFERWMSRCQHILHARQAQELHDTYDEEIIFLEELDSGWKDECLLLGRKLETWRDQLKDLGLPDHGSSLGTVVHGCRHLAQGMLMELGVMAKIERDAMDMEKEWIKGMNNEFMRDDDDLPVAGAVWRSR